MAENKGAEKKEKPKKEEAAERETVQERNKREKKANRWTLEACLKVAKRFETREEWEFGAPSCFKSATAHGWDVKCSAHMKGTPIKSAKKPVEKIVAKKKPQTRLPKSA
jgi:hypothetical protein